MKKPFLANFEVNFKDEIQGSSIFTRTLEDSDPDESVTFEIRQDLNKPICGFTQRTRTTEDSDTDESII